MDFLTDWLTNWLKELLIGGIMGNLEGLFDTVNTQVGEIAAQVGTTPAAWHAGVFSLIRQLSETVILPIAGMVLTFVATYELIQMLLEKNNMHEVDVANLYKWMFKTACAILILSNTFNIVMAVFDVSQSVIAQAGGLIQGSTDVSANMLAELETSLETMDLGPLLGLWLQSALIGFTMKAMGIIIFVLVYGADINAAGEEEVAEDTGGPIGGKEQAGRALAVLLKAKGIRSGDGERGHKSCLCGDGRHHGADDNAGSVEREHLTGVCSGENLHDNISYSLEHAGFAQHCADTECADEEPCGRTGKG